MVTGLAVEHAEYEDGFQTRVTRVPHPATAPHYARPPMGFAARTEAPLGWHDLPDTRVTVIINAAESFGGFPRAFVAGLSATPSWITLDRHTDCIDLKLTPLGAYTVLGIDLNELAGGIHDLADVLGPDAERLCDRVSESPDWGRRLELTEGYLAGRALAGPRPSAGVTEAWARLAATDGRVRIGALAAAVGWSHRHLVDRFRREIGLAPKTIARVLRFRSLLRRIEVEPDAGLAELAYDCGYYDQAHLNRDFREFAARTPSEFIAGRDADSRLW